ncbi:TPA: DUF3021 domain-containing protein [Salmonella enterica subsp. enterica]|nr:DUF3021 family protein [Salmonella enterica]EBB4221750.1 DUF3021 domain-containing protein [Salmonella enterica]HAU7653786.1 DUF3021 domain-containing protein [Salmonella enterica subsp. enterica]
MPKITSLSRLARLIKHLKNALRGVGIGSCIYVIVESVMHGTINGVEAAGVLTISAVLGLLSALFDIKAKPRAPLILLHFLLYGGCVALMVAMLSALNHFPVNASVILITSALFIVIYLPLGFILYRSQR